MESKTYMVFDPNGVHDYNIVVDNNDKGDRFRLYASQGGHWTEQHRGSLILTLVDDGNGVSFDRPLKKVDYSSLFELKILLNFRDQTDTNELSHQKWKVVEDKTLAEI